jgi:hypothetical protein
MYVRACEFERQMETERVQNLVLLPEIFLVMTALHSTNR